MSTIMKLCSFLLLSVLSTNVACKGTLNCSENLKLQSQATLLCTVTQFINTNRSSTNHMTPVQYISYQDMVKTTLEWIKKIISVTLKASCWCRKGWFMSENADLLWFFWPNIFQIYREWSETRNTSIEQQVYRWKCLVGFWGQRRMGRLVQKIQQWFK